MRRLGLGKRSKCYAPIIISLVGLCFVFYHVYNKESKYTFQFSQALSSEIEDIVKDDQSPAPIEESSKEFLTHANGTSTPIYATYDFDEEQVRRKTHLHKACDHHGIIRSPPSVSWATTVHFIVSDKFKFLFCFVPKVACTTWKDVMIEVYHNQVEQSKKRFVKLNEIKPHGEVIRRWRDYRKVIFVREPLARVLSAYLNKFRYGDEKKQWERRFGPQIARRTRNSKGPFKNFTFEEFLRFIISLGPDIKMNQMNDHWLPYSLFTSPCQVKYDFIGHFETLGEDGPIIIDRLGLTDVVQFPKVQSSRAVGNLQKEYENVPQDLIRQVQEFYHMDYELFGYSKEDSLTLVLGDRTIYKF